MDYIYIEYKELTNLEDSLSLTENIQNVEYPDQRRIAYYLLEEGSIDKKYDKPNKDIFTNEIIKMENCIRHDDLYCWDTILAYYVIVYNLRLPAYFEDHILISNYMNRTRHILDGPGMTEEDINNMLKHWEIHAIVDNLYKKKNSNIQDNGMK